MTSEKVQLAPNLNVSRIIHGEMRLQEWNLTNQELLSFIKECLDLGVTTFDHADIYGNYSCEEAFGRAIKLEPALKDQIQIVSKCGIKLISDKFPDRSIKHYDYSYDHIVSSAENSLNNLNIDKIDVFLLHRPAPFFNPEEVAKAFDKLFTSGKVLHFGVSNFTPAQFEALQSHLEQKLITNQVEVSPYNLEHFENGNMDFFSMEEIKPMAWSPLAGGVIFNPETDKEQRLASVLRDVARELNIEHVDSIIYAWLLTHPAKILPIVGSGKINRIKTAIDAEQIKIWAASTGHNVP